ncbi:tyrosine-type recombinase/integrase [Sneathiella sp.]|uniref:tyrosine-type recombinase/integrase n=1 Tax=Sneathiella sp. TaxID=1964365 RepID=UPI002FE1CAD5
MPKLQITDKGIAKLTAIDGKRTEYWDKLLPGFGVRVSDRGTKSFVVMYWIHRRKRRVTIGSYPSMSLKDARGQARELIEKVSLGEDPAGDRRRAGRPQTMGDLADEYLERHAKIKKKSWRQDEGQLERDVLPEWRNRDLTTIKRSDVIWLLDRIEARGSPISANRMLALLRKMYNWAISKDLVDENPAYGVARVARERSRQRVLQDDEILKIWNAASEMKGPWGPYIKLLMLTLQRRSEVAGIVRSEVDLEARMWTIPEARTKNGRRHNVPLSLAAALLLESIEDYGFDYYFPSHGKGRGKTPISGMSKAKVELDRLSGVTDWVLHDLRRTGTSYLAKIGIEPHVADKILNHVSGEISGVAAVYNRYQYDDRKRQALDLWARHIEDLVSDRRPKVVAFKGGKTD